MAILSILLTVIIVAVSILIVLIVLVQRPKQEGLGAAFGGSTLDSALGAHTSDVLQKMTTWLGIIFFVSAIGLAMVKTRQFSASAASDVLEEVENREPQMPALPPELSNLPTTPAPATTTPAAPKGDEGKAKQEAPKESPKAQTPKAAPKKEAPEKAAPKAASKEAPKSAPKGEKAKE